MVLFESKQEKKGKIKYHHHGSTAEKMMSSPGQGISHEGRCSSDPQEQRLPGFSQVNFGWISTPSSQFSARRSSWTNLKEKEAALHTLIATVCDYFHRLFRGYQREKRSLELREGLLTLHSGDDGE